MSVSAVTRKYAYLMMSYIVDTACGLQVHVGFVHGVPMRPGMTEP